MRRAPSQRATAFVAVTSCSHRSRSASSGLVMSGLASTVSIGKRSTGASSPLTFGRP